MEFSTLDELMAVFGPYDANVSLIERALDVSINARDKQVEVRGEAEARRAAAKTLKTPAKDGSGRGNRQRLGCQPGHRDDSQRPDRRGSWLPRAMPWP